MGEIAGVLRIDGGQVDPAVVSRLERSLGGIGKPHRVESGPLVMLHRPLRSIERDLALQPSRAASGEIVVADCRLDEPQDIADALGSGRRARRDDAALVVLACQRWGADAAARLNGGFAYAHWDPAAHRLVLARDALGTRPLYYVEHPQYLIFASAIPTLLALPEVPRDLDDMVMAQYLTLEPQDHETTVYRHIRRVPPGGMLIVENARARKRLYWTLDAIPRIRFKRDDDYVMAARELLDRAVACRLPQEGKLGVHLSGGFDSSGLAATAARLLGDVRLDAFHRTPGAAHPYAGMDERALIDAMVARYPNIALTVIDSDRQSEEDIDPERDAEKYFLPRMRGLNAGWFAPMADAIGASDVAVMFSGGVGNLTLSWEGNPHFAGDLRAGRWRRAYRSAAAAAAQRGESLPRFVAGRTIKPLLPKALMRWRAEYLAGEQSRWSAYSMVSDDFLASIDYAARVRGTGHDVPFQGVVDRPLRLHSLQSQRNRDKQFAVRRAGGPDTIDPYADRRLVEFTLGIPEAQFWHAGQDRWLARRVLADRLPPEILRERRRGLQSPDWFDAASRRREGMAAALDRISRSPLASRVVDVPRMKKLLDAWPSDAEAAKPHKLVYGYALARGISIGGFLRWHEGGNE